jgi:methionyl aminopeptidase
MIYYKTKEEIEILRQGGKILAEILDKIARAVKPGISTELLEEIAVFSITQAGGAPAFKDYDMGDGIFFPSALCVSVNNEVVHGSAIPGRLLKSGDIVGLDIGMQWPIQTKEEALKNNRPFNTYSDGGGFFTDTCKTVPVGKISAEAQRLLKVTKQSLAIGISKAIAGHTLNDIGLAIESYVRKNGYTVVEDMVGHGVGYFAHESPNVFNFEIGEDDSENMVLEPGMVIAIEPMVNQGKFSIKISKNDYTVLTSDGLLSAHFEHSVAILEKGNLVITSL